MKAFVVLRGLELGNVFCTSAGPDATPESIVKLADGTVAYELVGEYDTIPECQAKMYGRAPAMPNRELHNLLNRAAAALETPADLTDSDRKALIEDLTVAAQRL